MATAALPRTEIVDLRQVRSQQLTPLFEEQEKAWGAELRWDYAPSVRLIRKHIDTRSLFGYVAFRDGVVAGYCFLILEETASTSRALGLTPWSQKGLVGDLFVRAAHRPARPEPGLATQLLECAVKALEATPGVTRIEAQLMPFGIESLAPVFLAHNFRGYPRLFMYRNLKTAEAIPPGGWPEGRRERGDWAIEKWEGRYLEPLAELIVSAYSNHVDSNINEQYRSPTGALKFLRNIVVFPGCGVFQPAVSFVATRSGSRALAGALLVSQVAPGVGHVTQVCVRRELQGQGLGTQLLAEALAALRERGYEGVSLSVTAENRRAADLYRCCGFETWKEFAAYVWERPCPMA